MGQLITVTGTIAGDSAIFEADRSISGQDGGAFESLEDTVDDLIARADAALYAAKLAGRNCVMLERAEPQNA